MSVLEELTRGITKDMPPPRKGTLTPVAGEGPSTVATLAAGIVSAKAAVAAGIPADVPGVLMARERLIAMAAEMRLIADGLDALAGVTEAVATNDAKTAAREAKLAEKEADRKAADREAAEAGDKKAAQRVIDTDDFDAKLKAKQAKAQAQTFTAADAGAEEDEADDPNAAFVPAADGLWVCPEHGPASIATLTVRASGRTYRACNTCDEFEPKG